MNYPNDGLKKFVDAIDPLPFENCHTNHDRESILNIHKDTSVKDEMVYLYEEMKPSKNRVNEILTIGSSINFDLFDEANEEEF